MCALPRTRLYLVGLAVVLQACRDTGPTDALLATGETRVRSTAVTGVDSTVAAVAQGIALALAQPKIRAELLADLRDSPFPRHKIHLQSYLRGERGHSLAAAAARVRGWPIERFNASLASLPVMEISVPLASDRLRWAGGDDIVVIGTTAAQSEIVRKDAITGYSARTGTAVRVPLGVSLKYPLLAVAPAQIRFGANPERARKAAPHRPGSTVSTEDSEFWVSSDSPTCDPTDPTLLVPCDEPQPGGEPYPGGQPIPSGRTYECFQGLTAENDPDADGIQDGCEAELAYMYRPYLQFNRGDIYKSREPHWAAKRGSEPNQVRVFYAYAYHYDDGAPFWFDEVGAHAGDSEFLVFTLFYWSGKWHFDKAFLSAHYHKYGWDSSSTRDAGVFQYPGAGPRPKIWIARTKHANYHSQSKCDEGANYFDTCDSPYDTLEEFVVAPQYNLGNNESGRRLLLDIPSRVLMNGAVENFWEAQEFRGWRFRNTDLAAGAYKHWLDDFDF